MSSAFHFDVNWCCMKGSIVDLLFDGICDVSVPFIWQLMYCKGWSLRYYVPFLYGSFVMSMLFQRTKSKISKTSLHRTLSVPRYLHELFHTNVCVSVCSSVKFFLSVLSISSSIKHFHLTENWWSVAKGRGCCSQQCQDWFDSWKA